MSTQMGELTDEMRDEAFRAAKLYNGDPASVCFEYGWDAAVAAMARTPGDEAVREVLERLERRRLDALALDGTTEICIEEINDLIELLNGFSIPSSTREA